MMDFSPNTFDKSTVFSIMRRIDTIFQLIDQCMEQIN